MNRILTLTDYLSFGSDAFELGTDRYPVPLSAALCAALLAGVVLTVDLLSRRWLTAGQKNLLWGLVLIRLLMPWAPESSLSLQNLPDPLSAKPAEPACWLPLVAEEPAEPSTGYAKRAAASESAGEESAGFDWETPVRDLIFLTWPCAFVLILSWTALVNSRFSRRVRRAPVCQDGRIVELWKSCRDRVGVRRAIPIVLCDEVGQPALMGLLWPRLLLPTDVSGLDDDQLRMIMLHELAHVRRCDVALNWVMVFVRAIHWWNPIYWLAASRFASLREQACDAFVLRHMTGERKRDYSELLLTLAGRETAGRGWRVTLPASILGFLPALFRRRAVRQRLRAVRLGDPRPSRTRTAIAAAAIALAAAAGLTDAMPPAEFDPALDWVPAINYDAAAPGPDDGPLVTRVYDLTTLLARIEADAPVLPDAGPGLKWMIEDLLQIKRRGNYKVGSPPVPSKATYALEGTELTIDAPESLHDWFAQRLQIWQQSGFGQIAVGCEFFTADHDIASTLGVSWQFEQPPAADAGAALSSESSTAKPQVRAEASVTEYVPTMVATLSKQDARTFAEAGQRWSSSPPLQRWKVTVFNGQPATIGACCQTPLVVGLEKNQKGWEDPIIKVVNDGTQLSLRAVHSSDRRQINLKGRLEINKLGEVRLVPTVCNGMPAIVQAPSSRRWQIAFDSTVEEGQSVLIGFVPTYEKKLVVYALLTVQTVLPEPAVATK